MIKAMKRSVWLIFCGVCWLAGMYQISFGQKPELVVQTGHTSSVNAVSFSPDGKILASVSGDATIKLWEALTLQELRTLEGHTDFTNAVTFSPNGKILASGSGDTTIKLWDVMTGQELKTLVGHTDYINSLAFSPDGKMLASGSGDHSVKLWNVENSKVMNTLKGYSADVGSVEFSPDGKFLVTAGGDIKLWDIEKGKEIKAFVGSTVAKFSPDGKMLAIGFAGPTVTKWEGNTLILGNPYSTIKLLDVNSGQELKIFPHNNVNSLTFSPDNKILASSATWGDNAIKLWNIETGQELRTFKDHSFLVDSIEFSPDGKILASGGCSLVDKGCLGGKIKYWDTFQFKETETGNRPNYIGAVAFSPSGKFLAFGGYKDLKLWDMSNASELNIFKGHSETIESIAFSPDEKVVASGSDDETIKLWDCKSGKLLKTLDTKSHVIVIVGFSPDGNVLAVTGVQDDGILELWDIEKQQRIEYQKLPNWVKSTNNNMIKDGNGNILRSEINGNEILLRNNKTNKEIFSLFNLNDNDWLVTTPEGFFDGTPNAWKQLIWRFNNNTFDYGAVELYFNDFFYPNLLQDVLAGKSPKPKAGKELEKIDRRQPKVEIASINGQQNIQSETNNRTAKVVVKVTDNFTKKKQPNHNQTSGAQDLRLFRNGSLVKIWHGDVLQGKSNVTLEADVPIVAGENNFTAYTFNSSNVKSNDDAISIKGADSLKRDGTLYVLAIGVNDYAPIGKSGLDLNFAVPDVEEIGTVLKSEQNKLSQDTKLKQYAKTEIITLTDADATKDNILLALRRFSEGDKASMPNNASEKLKTELSKIKLTQPEDALIIHFSGHGTSREQRFYLLPHNFTNPKELEKQAVSDIELNQTLEKVDAGRLLMVIDACQSGQALGEENEGRAPMNSKGLAQLAYDKGMLILTAAQSQQAALEAPRIGDKVINHGLLTYALLEAMQNSQTNADKDANKQLWEREWFDFAVSQVPQLQLEAMKQRRIDLEKGASEVKGKSDIVYLDGDDPNLDPEKRRVQTPRVFYRRETSEKPFIVTNFLSSLTGK